MNTTEHQQLLAEKKFLVESLSETPIEAALTRRSLSARLKSVEASIATLNSAAVEPARAKLTFRGAPVVGSHGIFADFGMRAMNSFSEAVAAIAASLNGPLASKGPIPNRDQNQLLITGTALGSFGFELEEVRPELQIGGTNGTPVSNALELTQALLQSTLGEDDDKLADAASETDPRALSKVRAFLRVLADNDAVCTLQYGERNVRFANSEQVKRSIAALEVAHLQERREEFTGRFIGVLPGRRSFEFTLAESGEIIRGKIAQGVPNLDEFNQHLHVEVKVNVTITQAGKGRPRYVLIQMPRWPAAQIAG